MFTVFGASGNTGSVVARKLLDAGKQVRVLARDPKKVAALRERGAEVVTGDVTDAAAVRQALAGAEGAYLLVPPDLQSNDMVGRGRKIVDHYVAGLQAGKVSHAVMLSSVASQLPSGTGPIVITHYAEERLPASGAKLTFVRAAYFMENILNNAHAMKHDGVLPVFGGGETYPFPMVATKDIGATAADALLAPAAATQVIELMGPRDYSFADAAAEAGKLAGRAVKPLVLPLDQMAPALQSFGLSANVAGLMREMTAAFGKGIAHFEGTHRTLRGTTPLADVLRPALA